MSENATLTANIAGACRNNASNVLLDGRLFSELSARQLATVIAYVPPDPSLLFSGVMRTLRGEMEFSLEMLGERPSACVDVIERIVNALELEHLLNRDPFTFSGGERVRAALALAAVKRPVLWILDNVHTSLDPETADRIKQWLDEQRSVNGIIVIESHSIAPRWSDAFTQTIFLTVNGPFIGHVAAIWQRVAAVEIALLPPLRKLAWELSRKHGIPLYSDPTPETVAASLDGERGRGLLRGNVGRPTKSVLEVRRLEFRYKATKDFSIGPIDVTVRAGELVALLGPNGAGKTTLLKILAGFLDAQSGMITVEVGGQPQTVPPMKRRHEWAAYVQYAFQNPDDQLYHGTVRRELEHAMRMDSDANVSGEIDKIATTLGFVEFLFQSPHDLPRPIRRVVALACTLLAKPKLLLLDEPTVGLDGDLVLKVQGVLAAYLGGGGSALMVSHDMDFVAACAHRRIVMNKGTLVASYEATEWCDGWPSTGEPACVSVAKRCN